MASKNRMAALFNMTYAAPMSPARGPEMHWRLQHQIMYDKYTVVKIYELVKPVSTMGFFEQDSYNLN